MILNWELTTDDVNNGIRTTRREGVCTLNGQAYCFYLKNNLCSSIYFDTQHLDLRAKISDGAAFQILQGPVPACAAREVLLSLARQYVDENTIELLPRNLKQE